MYGASASCAYGRSGKVNDIGFLLGDGATGNATGYTGRYSATGNGRCTVCRFHVARIPICPDGSLAADAVLWQNPGPSSARRFHVAGSYRQGPARCPEVGAKISPPPAAICESALIFLGFAGSR